MSMMLTILQNVMLPIFILIGAGVFFHRKFQFDMQTLSKINFYYLIPTVIFIKIYESPISFSLLGVIIGYLFLCTLLLIAVTLIILKVFRIDRELQPTFMNSTVLANSGNFGLPVNDLVFRSDPFALSIQIIVMTYQNFLTFTYGMFGLQKNKTAPWWSAFVDFVKMPVFYSLVLGLIFNFFQWPIPAVLHGTLDTIAQAFLAIALLTLGAQVAYLKISSNLLPLILTSFCRLLVAPACALAMIYFFGFDGLLAQGLLIASAFPSSRNSAAIALEFNKNVEFAGQAVLVSTMLSGLTLTGVIFTARLLFGPF